MEDKKTSSEEQAMQGKDDEVLQKADEQTQQSDEDKLVNDAFNKLLESYLASRHRKKVDIITKAFISDNISSKQIKYNKSLMFIL